MPLAPSRFYNPRTDFPEKMTMQTATRGTCFVALVLGTTGFAGAGEVLKGNVAGARAGLSPLQKEGSQFLTEGASSRFREIGKAHPKVSRRPMVSRLKNQVHVDLQRNKAYEKFQDVPKGGGGPQRDSSGRNSNANGNPIKIRDTANTDQEMARTQRKSAFEREPASIESEVGWLESQRGAPQVLKRDLRRRIDDHNANGNGGFNPYNAEAQRLNNELGGLEHEDLDPGAAAFESRRQLFLRYDSEFEQPTSTTHDSAPTTDP
jgi:hypothetical protein